MLARTVGVAAGAGARVAVTVAAVMFGLVIGSFLNVVIYRVPRRLSVVQPGSFCPACGTPIRPSDNVPVISWVLLRARCRHCGEPISARYPAVELATGALFGAVAWALGAHWAVPGMCVLGATALALAAVEIDGLDPPPRVSLIGTGIGVALLCGAAVADRRWWHLGGMLIGIGAVGCVLVAGAGAARRRHAVGSLWTLLPAGAVMGWVGPLGAVVGVATFAALVVGLSAFARPGRIGGDRSDGASKRPSAVSVAAAAGAGAALIGAFVAGASIGV
ncbi:MAG TPA: prepilin peptidase [Acidimicrobiales bacterium]